MKKLLLAAALLASAMPASAEYLSPVTGYVAKEVTLDMNGQRFEDYHPVDSTTVYMRLKTGQWYRAVVTPCVDLTKKLKITYELNPGGTFDRNSIIRANGTPCQVESLTESGGPPRPEKHAAH